MALNSVEQVSKRIETIHETMELDMIETFDTSVAPEQRLADIKNVMMAAQPNFDARTAKLKVVKRVSFSKISKVFTSFNSEERER